MQNFAESIFPVGTVTTITSGITTALTENMLVIVGVLAFVVGLKWALKTFNHAKGGRV